MVLNAKGFLFMPIVQGDLQQFIVEKSNKSY